MYAMVRKNAKYLGGGGGGVGGASSVSAQCLILFGSPLAKNFHFGASLQTFVLLSDSAGVGRTGCFIVIDAMLERIKHEKTVDIYGHVTLMRAQRNYMVQTEDQYVFIHDALQEAVTCGTTEVPARNLYVYIQKLTQIESGENVTGMELEFKVRPMLAGAGFVDFCSSP